MSEGSVREFAERVLLGESLEAKLGACPAGVTVGAPLKGAYLTPGAPGRPMELRARKASGERARFPKQVETEEERARLLHFFANHELIAVELMALALLKFPDAPEAFRRGVLRTLQEEQDHTRWYVARMAECGVKFGDFPVTGMIWDHISGMESPLDYVSFLSLTFEQANLDYARHYAGVLAEAGDEKSAGILSQIYKDEIAHVGYGLKWLRRWKAEKESDWEAWHKRLSFPVTPIRAKGQVPFNEEGRRMAGLDEDFIQRLKFHEGSRGRAPRLWWFNPDAEAAWAATRMGKKWQAPARVAELAADMELAFGLVTAARDDVLLLRRIPSRTLRSELLKAGIVVPECVEWDGVGGLPRELVGRRLGELRAWAVGPGLGGMAGDRDGHATGKTMDGTSKPLLAGGRDGHATGKTMDGTYPRGIPSKPLLAGGRDGHATEGVLLSKEFALKLRGEILGLGGFGGVLCRDLDALVVAVSLVDGPVVVKEVLGAAGRGCFVFRKKPTDAELGRCLGRGAVIVEKWVEKRLEFSFLLDRTAAGGTKFLGLARQETDSRGQWLASVSARKAAQGLAREFAESLMREVLPKIESVLLPALEKLLGKENYVGPLAIDSFFYEGNNGELRWQPVVEVNGRWSMGRLAHEWRLKLCPTRQLALSFVKKEEVGELAKAEFVKGELVKGCLVLGEVKDSKVRVPVLRIY